MSLDRSIRWRGLDPATLEHCHVISTPRDTRIRGTIITVTTTIVIFTLKIFDVVWVMTQVGPVGASETMGTQLYKTAFRGFDLGDRSAMAVVLFLICLAFSLLNQRALRQEVG